MPGEDYLEVLRCPKGCDTRFIQYLFWEDTTLPIFTTTHARGKITHTLGLRCGDCGTQYGRKEVPDIAKRALDELLFANETVLQDLADQSDTDLLNEFLGDTSGVMEKNDGTP